MLCNCRPPCSNWHFCRQGKGHWRPGKPLVSGLTPISDIEVDVELQLVDSQFACAGVDRDNARRRRARRHRALNRPYFEAVDGPFLKRRVDE